MKQLSEYVTTIQLQSKTLIIIAGTDRCVINKRVGSLCVIYLKLQGYQKGDENLIIVYIGELQVKAQIRSQE